METKGFQLSRSKTKYVEFNFSQQATVDYSILRIEDEKSTQNWVMVYPIKGQEGLITMSHIVSEWDGWSKEML